MIRLKNLGEPDLFMFQVPGSLATNANADSFVVPFSGFLKGVFAAFATAGVPGTSNASLDIKQNGTSIFTATPNGIVFPFASPSRFQGSNSALTSDPLPVTAGDVFSLACVQYGSGTQPTNLGVAVVFTRRISPVAATLFGDLQLDLD